MQQLIPILILLVIVAAFGSVLLFLTSLTGPKTGPSAVRDMPYESGVVGVDTKSSRMSVRFYLTAILFIVFDIEIIFIYPWAVTFRERMGDATGMFMFFEMIVFMATLVWGLFYVWRGGALDWE